eukprot:12081508-Karenia_brevis.AAC.1
MSRSWRFFLLAAHQSLLHNEVNLSLLHDLTLGRQRQHKELPCQQGFRTRVMSTLPRLSRSISD